MVKLLSPGAEGLDYGSGPGPTLSLMFEEQGFRVTIYDPFFAPDQRSLETQYDFITCTETAEHFYNPGDEFDRLNRLLRPGAWLGLMTKLYEDGRAFETWDYTRDATHVCFYRAVTMQWIAARYAWTTEYPEPNVVLFQKPQ